MHDLAIAGEQLSDTAEAMLQNEDARAAVLAAVAEARAEGVPEAEIDAELAAYRAERFDLEEFAAVTTAVVIEREQRYPQLHCGWATLSEVARRAGVDEDLARSRYDEALGQGRVRSAELPAGAPRERPAFAPTWRRVGRGGV